MLSCLRVWSRRSDSHGELCGDEVHNRKFMDSLM